MQKQVAARCSAAVEDGVTNLGHQACDSANYVLSSSDPDSLGSKRLDAVVDSLQQQQVGSSVDSGQCRMQDGLASFLLVDACFGEPHSTAQTRKLRSDGPHRPCEHFATVLTRDSTAAAVGRTDDASSKIRLICVGPSLCWRVLRTVVGGDSINMNAVKCIAVCRLPAASGSKQECDTCIGIGTAQLSPSRQRHRRFDRHLHPCRSW